MTKWVIVQHSAAFHKREFARGLEVRQIHDRLVDRVVRLGGKVFDDYQAAMNYEQAEQYPAGVTGLIPRAPGRFVRIGELQVYIPINGPVNGPVYHPIPRGKEQK